MDRKHKLNQMYSHLTFPMMIKGRNGLNFLLFLHFVPALHSGRLLVQLVYKSNKLKKNVPVAAVTHHNRCKKKKKLPVTSRSPSRSSASRPAQKNVSEICVFTKKNRAGLVTAWLQEGNHQIPQTRGVSIQSEV